MCLSEGGTRQEDTNNSVMDVKQPACRTSINDFKTRLYVFFFIYTHDRFCLSCNPIATPSRHLYEQANCLPIQLLHLYDSRIQAPVHKTMRALTRLGCVDLQCHPLHPIFQAVSTPTSPIYTCQPRL